MNFIALLIFYAFCMQKSSIYMDDMVMTGKKKNKTYLRCIDGK